MPRPCAAAGCQAEAHLGVERDGAGKQCRKERNKAHVADDPLEFNLAARHIDKKLIC